MPLVIAMPPTVRPRIAGMRLPSTPAQIAATLAVALVGLVLVLITTRAGWIMLVGGTSLGIAGLLSRHR